MLSPFRKNIEDATMVLHIGNEVVRFRRVKVESIVHIATGPDTAAAKKMLPDGTLGELTDADTVGTAEAIVGSPRYRAMLADPSLQQEQVTSEFEPPYAEIQFPVDGNPERVIVVPLSELKSV